MTVWLLCAAVAPAQDPEDELSLRVPKCSGKSSSNWRKKTPEPSSFKNPVFFKVRVLRRFSPCLALRRSRKRSRIDSVRIRFLGQLRPSSRNVSRRRLCTEHAFLSRACQWQKVLKSVPNFTGVCKYHLRLRRLFRNWKPNWLPTALANGVFLGAGCSPRIHRRSDHSKIVIGRNHFKPASLQRAHLDHVMYQSGQRSHVNPIYVWPSKVKRPGSFTVDTRRRCCGPRPVAPRDEFHTA